MARIIPKLIRSRKTTRPRPPTRFAPSAAEREGVNTALVILFVPNAGDTRCAALARIPLENAHCATEKAGRFVIPATENGNALAAKAPYYASIARVMAYVPIAKVLERNPVTIVKRPPGNAPAAKARELVPTEKDATPVVARENAGNATVLRQKNVHSAATAMENVPIARATGYAVPAMGVPTCVPTATWAGGIVITV